MQPILLALLGGIAFSQSSDDAATLIQEVAHAARSMANWQIEGSISYPASGAAHVSSEEFKILMRSPGNTRFEQTGESAPAVIVCDGVNAWIYSPPLQRYWKESFSR